MIYIAGSIIVSGVLVSIAVIYAFRTLTDIFEYILSEVIAVNKTLPEHLPDAHKTEKAEVFVPTDEYLFEQEELRSNLRALHG